MPPTDSFAKGDADKDGYLTWEEFQKAFPSMRREAFNIIDADKDSRISKAEWDAFRSGHDKGATGQTKGMPPMGAMPLLTAPDAPATAPGQTAGDPAKPAPLPLLTPPGAQTSMPEKSVGQAAEQTPAKTTGTAPLPLLAAPATQAPATGQVPGQTADPDKTAPLPLLTTPGAAPK